MKLCALGILLCAVRLQAQLQPVERTNDAITAFSQSGTLTLEARELLIGGSYRSGRPAMIRLLVLFDRPTGLFLWERRGLDPNQRNQPQPLVTRLHVRGECVAYADPERIAILTASNGATLFILQSHAKANSMEDAEAKSLEAIRAEPDPERMQIGPYQEIAFWALADAPTAGLPREFFAAPGHSNRPALTVLSVTHIESGWEVTIQGQWTEKLLISDDDKLLGHSRIQAPNELSK